MEPFSEATNRELDRMLRRPAFLAGESVWDLAGFVEDLRVAYPDAPVDEATEARHVAAMVRAAHLSARRGDPVPRAAARRPEPTGRLRWRRIPVLSLRSTTAKIAAVVVVFLTAFSGLAVSGVLPDSVQSVVADLADAVGVELPDPDEPDVADDQGDADVDDPEVEDQGDADVDDPDVDDQGEDTGDDQGETDQGEDTGDDQGETDQGDVDVGEPEVEDQGQDAHDKSENAPDQGDDAHDKDDADFGEPEVEDQDEDADESQVQDRDQHESGANDSYFEGYE
jgi:hypothetical protein